MENNELDLDKWIGRLFIIATLIGATHFIVLIIPNSPFEPILTPLLRISFIQFIYTSSIDIAIYVYFIPPEIKIGFSLVAYFFPLVLSFLCFRYNQKQRNSSILKKAIASIFLIAISFFLLGFISPFSGGQVTGLSVVVLIAIAFWLITVQKNETRLITSLSIYSISFIGLMIGDVLAGLRHGIILNGGIIGGGGFGDMLFIFPFFLAWLAFYRKKMGFFASWCEALD